MDCKSIVKQVLAKVGNNQENITNFFTTYITDIFKAIKLLICTDHLWYMPYQYLRNS